MAVICFCDNDILFKLCAFDLLDVTIAALGCRSEDVRILDSAQFVLRDNRRVQLKYSEIIRARAIAFVACCSTVQPAVSDEFRLLRGLLDVGEATLVAETQGLDSFVLMTGDKRCLQTLVGRSELMAVVERLRGRVVCLEQVVLLLIRGLGFAFVKERVLPEVGCDTALRACFGSGEGATPENVIMALEGYIEALKQDAPGLLADMDQF